MDAQRKERSMTQTGTVTNGRDTDLDPVRSGSGSKTRNKMAAWHEDDYLISSIMSFLDTQEMRPFTTQYLSSGLKVNIWKVREHLQKIVNTGILAKVGDNEWVANDYQPLQVAPPPKEAPVKWSAYLDRDTIKDKLSKLLSYLHIAIPLPAAKLAVVSGMGISDGCLCEELRHLECFKIIQQLSNGWIKLKEANELLLSEIADALVGDGLDPKQSTDNDMEGIDNININDDSEPTSYCDKSRAGARTSTNGNAVAPQHNHFHFHNCQNIQVGNNNVMNIRNGPGDHEEEEEMDTKTRSQ